MNQLKNTNGLFLTLTMGIVLFILVRLILLTNQLRRVETVTSLRNYENEKKRLTNRYDETNMRINEIHRIIDTIK